MIGLLALAISADLQNRGFPCSVAYEGQSVDGRARMTSHVDVLLSRSASDQMGYVEGPRHNDPKVMVRGVGVDVRVYHASTLDGALQADHDREGQLLVDAVIAAIDYWCRSSRAGAPTWLGGMIGREPEAVGFAYELRAYVPRSVLRSQYSGAHRPTGVVASVETTVESRLDDGN